MTSWPWTLMVNGISSLQPKACTFVSCQFTSNSRMLLHLQLSLIWKQKGLAVQQRKRHRQQNPDQWRSFGQMSHQSSKIQQSCPTTNPPIHACGKWVWGQHTALANTSLDFKPWAVSSTCPNTTNRVLCATKMVAHKNKIQTYKQKAV